MDGSERSVMAGIHRLQHIERFLASNLTHDDAVRSHTQRIDQKLPLVNSTFPFNVWWPRFQADDVILMQLQFCRVFYTYNSFAVGDKRGQNVQQRGLSSAGTADYF